MRMQVERYLTETTPHDATFHVRGFFYPFLNTFLNTEPEVSHHGLPYVLSGNRNVQSLDKEAFKNLGGVVESFRVDPL